MLMLNPPELLARAARSVDLEAPERLSAEEVAGVYAWCVKLMTPWDLAQIVERCCRCAAPREVAALVRLLHSGLAMRPGPAARGAARIDPSWASPPQIAQMHLIAHQHYPAMLQELAQPGTGGRPAGADRVLASVAAEGARVLLGR
jgi:hypothetical protein